VFFKQSQAAAAVCVRDHICRFCSDEQCHIIYFVGAAVQQELGAIFTLYSNNVCGASGSSGRAEFNQRRRSGQMLYQEIETGLELTGTAAPLLATVYFERYCASCWLCSWVVMQISV
jgi:hypothetical protein